MRSKTVKQFCKDHNITKPTFYKEVAAARIRIFKIGTLSRISDIAEAEYIDACEKRAIAQAPIASAKARKLAAMRESDGKIKEQAAQPLW